MTDAAVDTTEATLLYILGVGAIARLTFGQHPMAIVAFLAGVIIPLTIGWNPQ